MSAPVNTAPVVKSVSPASGTVGTQVTITGSGFTGVTEVRFGAAAIQFVVKSSSEITATLPPEVATGRVVAERVRQTAWQAHRERNERLPPQELRLVISEEKRSFPNGGSG
jgi:IPT/TIG domain